MINAVTKFFDKLEDTVRIFLSRHPISYALIGAIGIILLWKGVWEMAEAVPILFGLGSVLLGVAILLLTGLLVSFFIGDSILISGLRREKKLFEKTEVEVKSEKEILQDIISEIKSLRKDIEKISRP